MKRFIFRAALLSLVITVILGTALVNAEKTSAGKMPFYVKNKTVIHNPQTFDLYKNRVEAKIETDPDALDYLLYESKSICVIYDDHARFAIASEKGLFLGTKRKDSAVVQCCLTTDRIPCHSTYESHSVGLSFGGKLLFISENARHVRSVFLLDWNTLDVYEVTDIDKFYGSSGGGYLVGIRQDTAYIFSLKDGLCRTVKVPAKASIPRLTDNGGVIQNGSEYLYLSLQDAAVYATSLSGEIYYTGDDYFIREDSYAVNVYLADGSSEKLIRKTDMNSFTDRNYTHGAGGSVLWFGAPYNGGRTCQLHDTWGEGCNVLNEMDTLSIENTLFPTTTFESGFFSNWYIMRTGSDRYVRLKEVKLSNRDTIDFRFTDTEYGYLGTFESNYPNSQYDLITGKKGARNGYYLFLYDENVLENYVVTIAVHPDPDLVRTASSKSPAKTSGRGASSADDEGLILYLPFEGTMEDATDSVRVTAYGNIAFRQKPDGSKCAYFDGDGDYLDLGYGFNFENDFTINLWVRSESAGRIGAALFAKYETNGRGPYAFYLSDDHPAIWISSGSGFSVWGSSAHVEDVAALTLNDGQWHMLTWTYRKAQKTIKAYVDGVERQSVTLKSDLISNTDRVTIGRQALMFQPYKDLEYKGYMDEVRVYDRCLEQAEIRSLFLLLPQ